jgi:hypothetical protein
VQQMQSMVYQAQKAGFLTGSHVTAKNGVDPAIWQIGAYVGSTITLLKQVMGYDAAQVNVSVEVLLSDYRIHKGQVTTLLPNWSFLTNPCSPLVSSVFKMEVAKAAVFIAMKDVYEALNPQNEVVELLVKPHMVKVTQAFDIGQFALAPASTRIDKKESTGAALCCGKFDLGAAHLEPLFISPMFVPPLGQNGEVNKNPWVCAMFHVPGSQKDGRPNLGVKCCPHMVGTVEVKIPILVNIKPLQKGDELSWDKSTAKTLATQRSKVTTKELMQSFNLANKKRKL